MLELSGRSDDQQLVAIAHLTFGTPSLHRGHFAQASEHMARALELYDVSAYPRVRAVTGTDLKAGALSWWALALWLAGYPDQADEKHRGAEARARELTDPFLMAYTLALGAWFHQYRREAREVLEATDELLAIATKREFSQWIPAAHCMRGWALAELGQPGEGAEEARIGVATFKAVGAWLNVPHFASMLAEALCRAGEFDEVMQVVDEALDVASKSDDRCWEPELHRLRASPGSGADRPKTRNVASNARSRAPVRSRRRFWSCGPRRTWRASGAISNEETLRVRCCQRSWIGSRKGSTRTTSGTRAYCCRS
jgi:predicted ATPase